MIDRCPLCEVPLADGHMSSPEHAATVARELGVTDAVNELHPARPTSRSALVAAVRGQVVVDGGCWIWTGPVDRGSPVTWSTTGKVRVRRMMYEEHVGPVPKGHVAAVSCASLCVAPSHLEVITSTAAAIRARQSPPRQRTPNEVLAAERRADAIRRSFAEEPTNGTVLSTVSPELPTGGRG